MFANQSVFIPCCQLPQPQGSTDQFVKWLENQKSEPGKILFDHNTCTLVVVKVIDLLNIEVKDDFC